MRYALCNETFQSKPFEAGIEAVEKAGYDGVEIAPFTIASDILQINSRRRSQIAQHIERCSLECVGLHWLLAKTEGYHLTSPEKEVRRKTTEYFVQLAQLCRDLNGSVLVFGSPEQRSLMPGVTQQQAMDYAREVLYESLPAMERNNVVLAIEPLTPAESDFLNTASATIELIERIGCEYIQLNLDCKAMSSERQPIPEIICESAKHIAHFHANDPNLQGPGFGDLEFGPIFKALRDADYDDWISVEVFDYSPGEERLAVESIEYLKECESN